MEWVLISAALLVAFSNGANDNFKGFATVWGSDTLNYRQALTLATLATVAGSLASLILAESLLQQFSGKGLVPDVIAGSPVFVTSVALGTAAIVFLATRAGLPISTTHALIGGLVGAGLAQDAAVVHLGKLANAFLWPLLISPLVAAILGPLVYRLFQLRPVEKDCACLVLPAQALIPASDAMLVSRFSAPGVVLAPAIWCARLGAIIQVSVSRSMDRLHVWSALSICFARGVNDTPKLTALLIAAHFMNTQISMVAVSLVMALGGVLFARQVAETMSQRVTRMDHAQGLAANLITAGLVLFASRLGLPVSTTHVAMGAIAGVGVDANTLNWAVLRNVLLSWVATMPMAALLAWSAAKIAGVVQS